MGISSKFDRTTPWKKIRREEFSSEKEELTASTSKPNDLRPDVVLVSSNGVEYPAHKSVLCAASSYFRAMFGGSFQETSFDRVVLRSVSSGMLRFIMDYLHLDKSEDKVFEDSIQPVAVDVFCAAHMLDVTRLVKLSCTLLGEGITRANYKKAWAIYKTYPTETLYGYLRASFRENYRHLFHKSCLTFDLSLMKFALDQWVPFVNHQLLVKLMLRWIQRSPTIREHCLDELSKILRPERLPAGLMNHLAAEEDLLQRHPDVLQQFQTSETTVDTTQFRRDAGYEVIADAISALFFIIEGNTATVERVGFSGCRERKVLPFSIRCVNSKWKRRFACVQYKNKVYLIGHVADATNITFIEYDFDDNSFVSMDSSPILALIYWDAFVVNDRLHVHCLDGSESFVQFYDFLAGRTWTRVLDSTVSKPVSLCPYGNSYLTLEEDGDENATKVTRVDDGSSFTIPCKHNGDVVIHHDGRLWWGCSEKIGTKNVMRKFVYDVNKKCFKSNCDYDDDAPVYGTCFIRIDTLQRHPLIVKCEMYPDKCYLTLLDTEHDDVPVGQIEQRLCLETYSRQEFLIDLHREGKPRPERVYMGMMAYCIDLTL